MHEEPLEQDTPDEEDAQDGADGGGTLSRRPASTDRFLAPPAARAEALRANAEALRRVDANQRKIAETMERADKATQVVTSTRALNETFRGLSEIQRGLLDAVLRRRDGGSRAGFLAGVLAAALVGGLLGFLFAERWLEDRTVTTGVHEAARQRAEALAEEKADLVARIRAAEEREKTLKERIEQAERGAKEEAARADKEGERVRKLETELESKQASLEQFVAVKAQADLAGQLQLERMAMERELRDLRDKVVRLEGEEARLLKFFGDRMLEDGRDPEEIKRLAQQLGILKGDPTPVTPPAEAAPDGPVPLLGGRRRLPDADEAYDLHEVGAIAEGSRFLDVMLTRHDRGLLVSTLRAKEMTLTVDPARDTVEVRLFSGSIAPSRGPGGDVPFGEEGHSIFLRDAGVKAWLARSGRHFDLGPEGRLTWKSAP